MIDLSQLNNFDLVVIGVIAISCLLAFFRGLVREILSLVAWIGAGIVTIYYFPEARQALEPHFRSTAVAAGAAAVGIYLAALFGFAMLNMFIMKSIRSGDEPGMLDNMLGLGFGALRGIFIVSLGYFLLTIALAERDYPEWLKTSVTRPYAEKGALMLARAAPDYLRDLSSLQKATINEIQERQRTLQNQDPNAYNEYPPTGAYENVGYDRRSSNQMNRVIDSADTP